MIKIYYAVCTKFYDNGKVVAMMLPTVEATEKPKSTTGMYLLYDMYVDYFETRKEALDFIKEAKNC